MAKTAWKPITVEIKRKVLVTNNIKARDAHGQMSHVWVVSLVQKDSDRRYGFISFDDRHCRVLNLTHYAELPI